MKTMLIASSLVLLAGCKSSTPNPSLTADSAENLCVQLANNKADSMIHRQPFRAKQLARFEDGRWIWTDTSGAGSLDFKATVELAANGSTNNVDVQILDIGLHPKAVLPVKPGN
jgi:hypothetical protein